MNQGPGPDKRVVEVAAAVEEEEGEEVEETEMIHHLEGEDLVVRHRIWVWEVHHHQVNPSLD